MKENSQLTVAILDTLTNLNLKADLLAEVRTLNLIQLRRGFIHRFEAETTKVQKFLIESEVPRNLQIHLLNI